MNESSTGNVESQNQNLLVKRHLDKAGLKRRVIVALLLVYYIWILVSAFSMGGWGWSPERGVSWSTGGPGRFFPIPASPGGLTVITYSGPVDNVFYLVFMHNGIWIAWIAPGLLYLFSPYRLDMHLLLNKIRIRLHDKSR